MTDAPFGVSDRALEWVWKCTEGHPYFVSFVMRDLVIKRRILEKLVKDVGKNSFRLSSFRDLNRGLISRLVKKSLLVRINRGEYKLYHPLFVEFVQSLSERRL